MLYPDGEVDESPLNLVTSSEKLANPGCLLILLKRQLMELQILKRRLSGFTLDKELAAKRLRQKVHFNYLKEISVPFIVMVLTKRHHQTIPEDLSEIMQEIGIV